MDMMLTQRVQELREWWALQGWKEISEAEIDHWIDAMNRGWFWDRLLEQWRHPTEPGTFTEEELQAGALDAT